MSTDLDFRPIVADEVPAFLLADEYGFGYRHDHEPHMQWAAAELDRTIAAFDGDEIVGTGRNYSLELTLPGGAIIPASGVSWISVRPTHRRRGILRSMMEHLFEESARRNDPVSMLTASEGGIYGRFGFGVATRMLGIKLARDATDFAAPVTAGRVRLVEPEASAKIAPEVFERVRAARTGVVSRPSFWWPGEWVAKEHAKQRFDVIYELDGRVDGYAVYNVEGTWSEGFSDKTVAVHDFVAATPQAEAALWQYLCSIDLTDWVTHWNVAPDIELPWLLRDSRQVRTTSWRDALWLRPVDTAAFLAARTYATEGRLTLEVSDETRPDGEAAGRFLLDGGPDGTSCVRTDRVPDLVLGVAALGAISLGGIAPSTLARAGTIEVREPGALARADRMFAADRAPYAHTWF
jgi:predicted acetyltransferase